MGLAKHTDFLDDFFETDGLAERHVLDAMSDNGLSTVVVHIYLYAFESIVEVF